MQRHFVPKDRMFLGPAIRMSSGEADGYLISGTLASEPRATWRWAEKRAVLRFLLPDTRPRTFFADFIINENTFKMTGPVEMRFFAGDKLMGSERYTEPGEKHYETKVPSSALVAGTPLIVSIEVDKVFTSPTDGRQLGFLIAGAGFQD